MAGARSLWRANGMREEQFGRPIIGIANSFTQFVPGHVHLHEIGQHVKQAHRSRRLLRRRVQHDRRRRRHRHGPRRHALLPARRATSSPTASNTWSTPTCADALVCISQLRQDHPGHAHGRHAAQHPDGLRLGRADGGRATSATATLDLIDAMVMGADDHGSDDATVSAHRALRLPHLRIVLGHVHRQLDELPHRGARARAARATARSLATHADRRRAVRARPARSDRPKSPGATTSTTTTRVLPRSIATQGGLRERHDARHRHGRLAPTPCCTCWPWPTRRASTSRCTTSTASRARYPCCARSHRNSHYHIEDVNRAGGILAILGELDRGGLRRHLRADASTAARWARRSPPATSRSATASGRTTPQPLPSAPAGKRTTAAGRHRTPRYDSLDTDRADGCIRDVEHAYFRRRRTGRAVRATSPATGCVVKTAGVDETHPAASAGPAVVFESQEEAVDGILGGEVAAGRRSRHHATKGPRAAPACRRCSTPPPTSSRDTARQGMRAHHRRTFLGRHVGAFDRPRIARSRRRRRDRCRAHGRCRSRSTFPAARSGCSPSTNGQIAARKAARETVSRRPHATAASRPRCAPTPCWSARPTRAPCA